MWRVLTEKSGCLLKFYDTNERICPYWNRSLKKWLKYPLLPYFFFPRINKSSTSSLAETSLHPSYPPSISSLFGQKNIVFSISPTTTFFLSGTIQEKIRLKKKGLSPLYWVSKQHWPYFIIQPPQLLSPSSPLQNPWKDRTKQCWKAQNRSQNIFLKSRS